MTMPKKLFLLTALITAVTPILHAKKTCQPNKSCDNGHTLKATPYFAPRSQSVDSARELVGWANDYHIHQFGDCDVYGSFSVTFEYINSFDADKIAQCIFGDSLATTSNPSIVVSGSRVENRGTRDWLADYFGLPTDFQSNITFDPSVKTALFDFNFFIGLNEWATGMFFRVHAPIVHTKWSLGVCENVIDAGINGYDAGYFAPEEVPREFLLERFTQYAEGMAPRLSNTIYFEELQHSKWATSICKNNVATTRVSEVQMALGWDVLLCQDYHLGLEARTSIPTGTRPEGIYLFEPVVGNGHHWEFGLGVTTHYTFFRDEESGRSAGIYVDGNITHMFNARQCRVFDLCNGASSRYMLAEQFISPVRDGLQGNPQETIGSIVPTDGYTAAEQQLNNIFSPVANISHSPVEVSVPVQVDITTLLDWTFCGLSIDVGYNFWYRSCEKIKLTCPDPTPFESKVWALKGDAHVFGYTRDNDSVAVALSATQSTANLYNGTNRLCGEAIDITDQQRNIRVDNKQFAYADISGSTLVPLDSQANNNEQISTSIQPVFLDATNIDINAASTKGLSNKAFAHVSYTWDCLESGWIPYLGIGGKAEFAKISSIKRTGTPDCFTTGACPQSSCCDQCSGCKSCALSQWGIWIKGGFTFE